MRIKRGTVYVFLEPDQTQPNRHLTEDQPAGPEVGPTTSQTDLVEFLREELKSREEFHVEESRRKDTIIAQLTQRIRELPPAKSHQEVHLSEANEAPRLSKPRPRWWSLEG